MPDQIPFKFEVPSVTELTAKIKQMLESSFTDVLVEGELSNVKRSRNGHLYFTVKDNGAQLPCVMWKNTSMRMETEPADGQQVILGGNIQVYAPHGRYQLIVNVMEQAGLGRLQQAFEKLKRKLQEEGLFDEVHKKKLPRFPQKMGIITSSTGAALQDILTTLKKRWPLTEVCICHASVQGVNAASEIARGIRKICRSENIDLLIIGRGGGSLEDLWPFNEEAVARAIFECPVPVISAVGHEVDFSISDFVADARAATPTQAAVLATPDINEIKLLIEDQSGRLAIKLMDQVNRHRETVKRLGSSHALLVVDDRIKNRSERIDNLAGLLRYRSVQLIPEKRERVKDLRNSMVQSVTSRTSEINQKLTEWIHRLEKADPSAPLEKGFVRIWQNEKWVRNRSSFNRHGDMEIEWKDGKISFSQQLSLIR